MLVFIDESGDPGFKIDKGSSRFFVIALIVFDDATDAVMCDQRISMLKRRLGWSSDHEFHFRRDSDNVRRLFLTATASCNFRYFAVVIRKEKRMERMYHQKAAFYNFACRLVFQHAQLFLKEATIIIDKSGNQDFRNQLAASLRKHVNVHQRIIHKVKMQRSQQNQLIQLADYIAGVVHCAVQRKHKYHDVYYRIARQKEVRLIFYGTKTADPIPSRERER